jgi:DNA-binding MarR family transcriptional regulator
MTDEFDSLKLGNQLCFAVYTAAHAFNAAYKPFLEALGLTYPQYLVLMVLWEQDGLMVKDIGERLSLDSGTITPILKRLEAAGFVTRQRDTKDERQVRVALTKKARDARPKALEMRNAIVCALGDSEAEIQKMKATVDQLHAMLRNAA